MAGGTTQEQISLVISAVNRTQAELNRIVADLNKVGSGANKLGSTMQGAMGQAESAAQGLAARLGPIGSLLTGMGGPGLVAAGAVAAAATAFVAGTKAAAEWEQRMLRTQAVLKATGDSVGMTAEELAAFAKAQDLATLQDKTGILDAMNVLMTFKSLSGETFKQALILAEDMSATFGQDLRSSTTQLGKALEDPIAGLTALRRVGVSFTESEKDMIKAMVEAGDKAGAQAVIFKSLEGQIGGAAKGQASGLTGKVDELSYEWGELLETFGDTEEATTKVNALVSAIRALRTSVAEVKRTTVEGALETGGVEFWLGGNLPSESLQEGTDRVKHQIRESEKAAAEAGAEAQRQAQAVDAAAQKAKTAREKAEKEAVKAAELDAKLRDTLAQLTMDAKSYQLTKAEEEAAQALAKGADASLVARVLEARRAQVEASLQYDPELKAGYDSAQKANEPRRMLTEVNPAEVSRAAAEGANAMVKDDLAVLTEFDKAFRETVSGETAFKLEQIERQAKVWAEAGADEVRIAEWVESEKLALSRDWSDGAIRSLRDYADEAGNLAEQVGEAFSGAFSGMEDALVDFVQTGKLSFDDLLNTLEQDLVRMGIRSAITGPLAAALSGGSTTGGASSGTGLFGWLASMFHEGGVVGQATSAARFVPPDVFASAPRLHSGGYLAPDERPIIARVGETILTSSQMAGLKSPKVSVNVINNAGAEVSVQQQPDGRGGVSLDVLLEQKMAQSVTRPGSQVRRALASGKYVQRG